MPRATPPCTACRILVYGVTGSGKSTAASRIAELTGLPLTLVDELTWQPGWVMVEEDRQREIFTRVTAAERWVLDSAYGSWLDVVLSRADLVVALDYPRWYSLQRLVRRTVVRAIDKRPICHGNVQTWGRVLGRDSIISWHFDSFRRKRDRVRQWEAAPTGPEVLAFRRHRDLERWIECLPATHPAAAEGGSPQNRD